MTDTLMQELDRQQCMLLLSTQTVGRVVVVDHGNPHIVPVNYALDGDAVVFRTAIGTKLDGASRSHMAFEVDQLDAETRSGWSVVVHGVAQEVTSYDSPTLVERLRQLSLDPWAPGEKPHLVRLPSHVMTGRRIIPQSGSIHVHLGLLERGHTLSPGAGPFGAG